MLGRLHEALKLEGSIAAIAKKAGVSRTALSLILNGKYKADPKKILRKVEDAYRGLKDGMVLCPALKEEISSSVCKKYTHAIKSGEVMRGHLFSTVKETCPFCSHY